MTADESNFMSNSSYFYKSWPEKPCGSDILKTSGSPEWLDSSQWIVFVSFYRTSPWLNTPAAIFFYIIPIHICWLVIYCNVMCEYNVICGSECLWYLLFFLQNPYQDTSALGSRSRKGRVRASFVTARCGTWAKRHQREHTTDIRNVLWSHCLHPTALCRQQVRVSIWEFSCRPLFKKKHLIASSMLHVFSVNALTITWNLHSCQFK